MKTKNSSTKELAGFIGLSTVPDDIPATTASAPGGKSRPRAARNAPGLVTRGHYPQGSLQEV